MQTVIVSILVSLSAVYAVWTLCPKALRRRLAQALLRLPLPVPLQNTLQAAAVGKGGCACNGCDSPARSGVQPVVLVRSPRPARKQP